jgi:hypothetical protein
LQWLFGQKWLFGPEMTFLARNGFFWPEIMAFFVQKWLFETIHLLPKEFYYNNYSFKSICLTS